VVGSQKVSARKTNKNKRLLKAAPDRKDKKGVGEDEIVTSIARPAPTANEKFER
jgi:hypothetical protein